MIGRIIYVVIFTLTIMPLFLLSLLVVIPMKIIYWFCTGKSYNEYDNTVLEWIVNTEEMLSRKLLKVTDDVEGPYA
jgi:hypothetical protein